MKYTKDGNVVESVGAIIFLIVGIGVATLVLIFVSVLGGQTYSQTASSISAISDANIKNNVTAAIGQAFVSLNTTGSYLPIIVLAVVIFIVLALVMGIMPGLGFGGYGGGYGGSVL